VDHPPGKRLARRKGTRSRTTFLRVVSNGDHDLVRSHLLDFSLHSRLIQRHCRFSSHLTFAAQLRFQSRKLGVDILLCFALANDFFAIAPEEIIDSFDSDSD